MRSAVPKPQAQTLARSRRIPVRKIPRFTINVPPREPSNSGTLPTRQKRESKLEAPDPNAKLWLANLPHIIDEAALSQFLAPFGEVQNIYIPKHRDTGEGRGYAFVEFETAELAAEILTKLNGQILQGRPIVVRKATPRGA